MGCSNLHCGESSSVILCAYLHGRRLVRDLDRARRLVGVAVVGIMLTSGCGSRLDLSTTQPQAAADAAIGRGTQSLSQGITTGGLANGTTAGTTGAPPSSTTSGSAGVVGSSGGTTGSSSGTTGGTSGSTTGGPTGPINNGGATDVGV